MSETLINFWDETVIIQEQPDGTVTASFTDEDGQPAIRTYYHTDFDTVSEKWYRKGYIYF
jgi:hypothetical protein